jgi:two-component system cell cycle sensor histidine kinase/response regulator CckA
VALEGSIRDVSERVAEEGRRRTLETQLRQAEKLKAVGQLAGGIAHDFNNLLLAVRGYGESALRLIGSGNLAVSRELEGILDTVDRATSLTQPLLAFSRRKAMPPRVLDLNEIVAEMYSLLRRFVGDNVELTTIHPDQPVPVTIDRSRLEQVLANLAVNARDAMPDGGRLAIEVTTSSPARDAVLVVGDDGLGMDAETARRIFEPFFTTKGDHGTGLGLATVHGIITQSGGRISVESRPGRGTTFKICLPLATGLACRGAETILLVEDDPNVRSVAATMLEERGYTVLPTENGDAAVALAADSRTGPISLLLSDLIMRGASGRQAAERVRKLQPGVKVLFMSAYTGEILRVADFPGAGFIQKPFTGDELARHVRGLLDGPADCSSIKTTIPAP